MSDDLDQKLKGWTVDVQVPPRFRAEVWQRIAAREAVREQSFSRQLAAVFAMLARPRYAVACASLMLFAGITTAHLQARETNSDVWQKLQTRYVTSIDPQAHAQAAR